MNKVLPRNRNSLAIIIFMLIWSFPQFVCAQTIYVNSSTGNDTSGDGSSGSPYKTFTKGYAMTSSGGILDLMGTFTWSDADETGDGSYGFEINKNITIQGPEGDLAVVRPNASLAYGKRIFEISSGVVVTLKNLDLYNGYPHVDSNGGDAGGLLVKGTLTVLNCYIHDNKARQGCGLEVTGNLTMENSTVSNNVCTKVQSGVTGGGIRVFSSGNIIITNSTISHNTDVDYGGGMEIDGYTGNGPTVIVTNCTIANNSAMEGGGLTTGEGTLLIKNSIIANNTETNLTYGGADIDDWDDATITDNGNNIVGVTNSSQILTTNISNLNLSSTLADNSSVYGTPTLALSSGSIAINAGNSSSNGSVSVPTTDQRGLSRNGTTDIGAYEYDGIAPSSNAAPTASSFTTSSGPYTNNVYTFSTSDFGYSDTDSDPLDHVRVTAIPGSGVLYVDADNGNDYDSGEEIANNAQVSKADLDAGNLQFYTASASNTSFTFDVNDGTAYSASTYTATLSVSDLATTTYSGTGSWSTRANWSPGIPGTTTDVVIAGNCTVDADYEVTDMTINSGAVVSVNPGNVLTVSGTLTNNEGVAGLVLETDITGTGMLMNNSAGVQATVKQYLVKDQWHYMGLPVTKIDDANDVYHACYLYTIREDSINWYDTTWVSLAAGDPMDALRGYAVMYNSTGGNDTTITFSGTLNTGVVDTTIYSQMYGWNFFSNPYPVTLDWDASGGKSTTSMNNAIYLWNPSLGAYGSYVDGTSTNGQTRYIPPMQGFFVQVYDVNSSLSFNDNAKVTQTVAFKSATVEPHIRLAVTDDDINFDEMVLRVKNGSTTGFDGSYDATKMKALNSMQPLLWSVLNSNEYSINSIPEITEETVIPLKVLVKTTGTHKLVLNELKAYDYPYPIVLFDENKNKVAELVNEEYVFEGQKNETKAFYIGFQSILTSTSDILQNDIKVFNGNHTVVVNGLGSGTSHIHIYNLSGAEIYERTTSSNELTVPLSPSGVYIVKVIPERGNVVIQKVFIN